MILAIWLGALAAAAVVGAAMLDDLEARRREMDSALDDFAGQVEQFEQSMRRFADSLLAISIAAVDEFTPALVRLADAMREVNRHAAEMRLAGESEVAWWHRMLASRRVAR